MWHTRKKVLEKVGGFDERYNYYEDRDLALRVKKLGKIEFNPKMIIYHRKVTMTPKSFIRRVERVRNRVLLFKRFRDRRFGRIPDPMWRILHPLDLIIVICPPLIFSLLKIYNFRNKED
jgi:GT2 family glycosyltransferase